MRGIGKSFTQRTILQKPQDLLAEVGWISRFEQQSGFAIVEDFHRRITKALAEAATGAAAADGPQAMLKASFRRWLELFAAHRDAATVDHYLNNLQAGMPDGTRGFMMTTPARY